MGGKLNRQRVSRSMSKDASGTASASIFTYEIEFQGFAQLILSEDPSSHLWKELSQEVKDLIMLVRSFALEDQPKKLILDVLGLDEAELELEEKPAKFDRGLEL